MATKTRKSGGAVPGVVRDRNVKKLEEKAKDVNRRIAIVRVNVSGIERQLKRKDIEKHRSKGLMYHLERAGEKLRELQECKRQLSDFRI